ncbi:MAG: hypothetical protein AABX29_04225 [Nanoarchaeota archaeon]
MDNIFEVVDKGGRKVYLSKERWRHIRLFHLDVESQEEIMETLRNPDNIIIDGRENVENFYKFFKHKSQKSKFLKVIVKFLNGEGFILSAHFARNIK